MADGIVARGLKKVRKMLTENPSAGKLTERQLNQIRDQLPLGIGQIAVHGSPRRNSRSGSFGHL